jgi:cob(I)alamin adenosyltransferase
MPTAQQRKMADEVRSIRAELHNIAASLHPQSDAHQRAVAEKKITELEQRIDALEARQKRRFS